MRELNTIQKILIKQWFNKRSKSKRAWQKTDCSDLPHNLYKKIEKINDMEILNQCIDQYLDELNGAI